VWLNGDTATQMNGCLTVRLLAPGAPAIRRRRAIGPSSRNYRSFLDIYEPNRNDLWRRFGGLWAVIKVAYASHIVNDKSYEQYARRGGFT